MPFENPWVGKKPKSVEELNDLIDVIVLWLTESMNRQSAISKFCSASPPQISLTDYLQRFLQYVPLGEQHLITMVIYLCRYFSGTKTDSLNMYNVHRLILSIICVGHKYWDDKYWNLSYYARIGGVTVTELTGLEVEILFCLKFDLHVTSLEYLEAKRDLSVLARKYEKTNSKPFNLYLSQEEEAYLAKLSVPPLCEEASFTAVAPVLDSPCSETLTPSTPTTELSPIASSPTDKTPECTSPPSASESIESLDSTELDKLRETGNKPPSPFLKPPIHSPQRLFTPLPEGPRSNPKPLDEELNPYCIFM